jgi:hypothetical protein
LFVKRLNLHSILGIPLLRVIAKPPPGTSSVPSRP